MIITKWGLGQCQQAWWFEKNISVNVMWKVIQWLQFHVPLEFVKPLLWSTLSEIMEQSPQGVFLLGSQQANNLVHVLNKSRLPLQLSSSTFYFIIAFSHIFWFLVHYLNHFIFFSLLRTRVNQCFFLELWQVSIKSIVIFPNSGSDRDIHELSGNLFTYL